MASSASAVVALGLAALSTYLAKDWIAGVGILVLFLIWKSLFEEGQPPVLAMALSFQWVQVTLGIYYFGLTGREVEAMYASDYRPMVLVGLGCVTALLLGLWAGLKLAAANLPRKRAGADFAFSWRGLFAGYVASIFLSGVLHEVAWHVPLFTQGVLAISYLRLGLLYLIFRRLTQPVMRWAWFIGILIAELVLGFSGYFASFREPLVLAALALIECFDRRLPAHWIRLSGLAAAAVVLGVLWLGVRTTYREEFARDSFAQSRSERLETLGALSSDWLDQEGDVMVSDMDHLVERLWAVYYPAVAVSRVPDVLPHENGNLMWTALKHVVTPRFLFPDKGVLASDSELVRKYTGIPVAGAEENTSIAFGYAAESYVDFGVPLMFLPSIIYGFLMGILYRVVYHVMHHRELAVALVSVVFWLSLYLFERSWIKTFGLTATLAIYLGAVVYLIDRRFRSVAMRMGANRSRAPIAGGSSRYLQSRRIDGGASPAR